MFDIKEYLGKEKNKFLDESHLDWYVATFIRNYPEFLQSDYEKAIQLAKDSFQNDLDYLTSYISELNRAYIKAKEYLGLDEAAE